MIPVREKFSIRKKLGLLCYFRNADYPDVRYMDKFEVNKVAGINKISLQ